MYFRTIGHHSSRCSTCKGIKKSGSEEKASPAQIYQPVVSPLGMWRSPLIGQIPSWTFFDIPTFKDMEIHKTVNHIVHKPTFVLYCNSLPLFKYLLIWAFPVQLKTFHILHYLMLLRMVINLTASDPLSSIQFMVIVS
jgi:hypothetical protein